MSVACRLVEIEKHASEQSALIDSLLPKGASAGLAAAFASRGKDLNTTKIVWMSVFIATVAALGALALVLATDEPKSGGAFILHILQRLPLAAPLVWLGWFSAVQYGNTVRVQEDYAFKEATSKAFQGYRDHMEHLADVNDVESRTALNLLSVRTIEILAREPLRIFGKSHHDATPATGVISAMTGRTSGKDAGNADGN
jgi:hypothetical protein